MKKKEESTDGKLSNVSDSHPGCLHMKYLIFTGRALSSEEQVQRDDARLSRFGKIQQQGAKMSVRVS